MKIAYFSGVFIPSKEANSIQVMKMCEVFAKAGHDVILSAWKGETATKDVYAYYGVKPCFEIKTFKRSPVYAIKNLFYSWDIMRQFSNDNKPDLFYGRYVYALAAFAVRGFPVVYESHAPPRGIVMTRVERLLFKQKHFLGLVVISEAIAKKYLQIFPGLAPDKILIAHDGANVEKSGVTHNEDKEWPGRKMCLQVGYVGHLYPGKGVEVIAEVSRKLTDVDFHIVGGLNEDIERWKKIIKSPNVYFHGFVPHGQLDWYFNKFDVVLAPLQKKVTMAGGKGGNVSYSSYNSPLKIFEYMAAKKPIVASNLPVLCEVLQDKVNCLLCPPDDIELWASAIIELVENPELREKLAMAAYLDLVNKYSWDVRVDRILKRFVNNDLARKT